MEAIKTSFDNAQAEPEVKGKAVKKSGKRIGYNYIILKSLKESQKNDVVKCLFIKSLTNFGLCVIKEGGYGDTKDKQGRDIKDRLKWQKQLHEFLQDKVRLPRLLGSFEEKGNYYLVLERIRGKTLYKTCKEAGKELRMGLTIGSKLGLKFLGYMIQMIELLEELHKHKVVHRDVSANNFMITPAGKVAVIDMELSYSLEKGFPDPPFQLGTYGYMSPEQEEMQNPAYEQDIFSAGVILLQMWTMVWPTKLTDSSYNEIIDRINFFIPDKGFADIIKACLDPEPKLRPTLQQVKNSINAYRDKFKQRTGERRTENRLFTRNEMLQTVQKYIGTLTSPLLVDEERGWFSENTAVPYNEDKKKINKAWYASVQKGASGIIYFLSKANSVNIDIENTKPYIQKGVNLFEARYILKIEDANAGLHYGGAGIAAVMATAIREGAIEPQSDYFEWINRLLELNTDSLGIQNGLAGQGIANWLCDPFLHPATVKGRVDSCVRRLIDLQKKDGSWERTANEVKSSRKVRITRGFAHGVAGIVYFLLEYGHRNNDAQVLKSAYKGLKWLMEKSIKQKDCIDWKSSQNKKLSAWWCEGACGIALTFLKAYSISGDKKFREIAIGALSNHNKDIIGNNLSQCHGLSGLGEIYLEAYKVLQNEEWLERAGWIAQVAMHLKLNHAEHGPYWLVGNERQPVADFMVGNSGVAHYLLRYCHQDKIGFPLFT